MKYIDQPRGAGTAYRFKMKPPKSLNGLIDPQTGKKFSLWIIRSFGGERNLQAAKKLRDIRLAEVRAMEADAAAGRAMSGRFGLESAEAWALALRVHEPSGDPDDHSPDIAELIQNEIERAPKSQRKAFAKVALSGTLSAAEAMKRYLHDRREGNGHGYATLRKTTQNDLGVALRYLCNHADETPETLFLEDVTSELAASFRGDFLPVQTSPRAPHGLSLATIEKLCGLLRNMWKWAIEHRHVRSEVNPFDLPKGVRRIKRDKSPKRDMFQASEVNAILAARPAGDRLGDIFRIALISGCRADEIAKVTTDNVTADGAFYYIGDGKTGNAKRTVPIPQFARHIVQRRRQAAIDAKEARLFFDYPLRPSTGKVSSLSQEFTRVRRVVLGRGSDGRLAFHSLRHTWMTKARQAGVPAGDYNDLGVWAGERTSASSYDHGLLEKDLAERQEQVAARMRDDGYLAEF